MHLSNRKQRVQPPVVEDSSSSPQGNEPSRARRPIVLVICLASLVVFLLGKVHQLEMKPAEVDSKSVKASASSSRLADVSVQRLIELEERFGGLQVNVPRQVISELDPRAKSDNWNKKKGMQGGDRMSSSPPHHNYGVVYESILRSLQNAPVTAVAEIGILKGSGLAIWSELFPEAKIHGFDVNLANINENMDFLKSRGAFASNNLELHNFDQFAPQIPTKEQFQLIIDDGMHTEETVRKTFDAFEPWLHQDGTYVVEDCECQSFQKYMKETHKDDFNTVFVNTNIRSAIVVITRRKK